MGAIKQAPTTRWTFRWPTAQHKIASEIARRNNRSLNEQVQHWLESGDMPSDLLQMEVRHLKDRYVELIDTGAKAPPGMREAAYAEAEGIRSRLEAMGVEEFAR